MSGVRRGRACCHDCRCRTSARTLIVALCCGGCVGMAEFDDEDYSTAERESGAANKKTSVTPVPRQQRSQSRMARSQVRVPTRSASAAELPPLESRYLDNGVKFEAQRQMSRLRREAASVKARLQRMFRELDRFDDCEREKEERRARELMAKPPAPLTKRQRRRHTGDAAQSPSSQPAARR